MASEDDIARALDLLPVLQTRLTDAVTAVSLLGPALPAFKQLIEVAKRYRPDLLSGEMVAYIIEVTDLLIETDGRLREINERLADYYAEKA